MVHEFGLRQTSLFLTRLFENSVNAYRFFLYYKHYFLLSTMYFGE